MRLYVYLLPSIRVGNLHDFRAIQSISVKRGNHLSGIMAIVFNFLPILCAVVLKRIYLSSRLYTICLFSHNSGIRLNPFPFPLLITLTERGNSQYCTSQKNAYYIKPIPFIRLIYMLQRMHKQTLVSGETIVFNVKSCMLLFLPIKYFIV